MIRIVSIGLGLGLAVTATIETPQKPSSGLPARLAAYVTRTAKLSDDERSRLTGGEAVTKLLDVDESKEVAVFGAIWMNASIQRYVEAVKDIETLERGGGFKLTKRISTPPRLEDFAGLRIPEEDLDDLRSCRVGECEIKLGEAALRRFQTEVDWKGANARSAANALMQRLAFEYVTGYLQGGNERLAVYRDQSRPTFVAQEFREMTDRMPELTADMLNIRRYLLEYPKVMLPDSASFLYWQETEFGLKPTIRISHVTIRKGKDDTLVASKMLYASHYFWTGLELRVLLPDPSRGPGFWFITLNRSRSDGLSGSKGAMIRRRVRSEVESGVLKGLQSTKRRLEASR